MNELLLSIALLRTADTSVSLAAFAKGAHEQNPFIVSEQPAAFIAQVTALTAVEFWALKRLEKRHPKLARALAYVDIGGSIAAITKGTIAMRQWDRYNAGRRPS